MRPQRCRWGRSVQDLILTMAEMETLGVAFVVPGHIDMSTPMGRMMAHLLSAVAEFERELIRERVRSGLANARAKGKRLGRPCATARQVDKGLSLIKQGVTYPAAAKRSGVSISTLLRAHRKTRTARPSKIRPVSQPPEWFTLLDGYPLCWTLVGRARTYSATMPP